MCGIWPVHFRKGIKGTRRHLVIQEGSRGEAAETKGGLLARLSCCLPVSLIPRSADAAQQRNTNGIFKQSRLHLVAQTLPSFGSASGGEGLRERVRESRKKKILFSYLKKKKNTLNKVISSALWYMQLRVNQLRRRSPLVPLSLLSTLQLHSVSLNRCRQKQQSGYWGK